MKEKKKKVRKLDVVNKVHTETGIERAEVSSVLESFMRVVIEHVSQGESISLRKFGCFSPKIRKTKIARNISKNEEMVVPAHCIPFFKPAPGFSKRVKQNVTIVKEE